MGGLKCSDASTDLGAEQLDIDFSEDSLLFTRAKDPFNPNRVKHVIQLVQIGNNLDEGQRQRVHDMIARNADIFTLSVSEVMAADSGAVHTMHVPEGATFSKKIHQRLLKAPKREYYFPWVDTWRKHRSFGRSTPLMSSVMHRLYWHRRRTMAAG